MERGWKSEVQTVLKFTDDAITATIASSGANSGCGTEVVDEWPPRLRSLGLPPVFLAHRQVSWVELEAGADLHVRLLHARIDLPGATLLERLASSRQPATEPHPTVVASFDDPVTSRKFEVEAVATKVN